MGEPGRLEQAKGWPGLGLRWLLQIDDHPPLRERALVALPGPNVVFLSRLGLDRPGLSDGDGAARPQENLSFLEGLPIPSSWLLPLAARLPPRPVPGGYQAHVIERGPRLEHRNSRVGVEQVCWSQCPLFLRAFCGALCARASICAYRACNISLPRRQCGGIHCTSFAAFRG